MTDVFFKDSSIIKKTFEADSYKFENGLILLKDSETNKLKGIIPIDNILYIKANNDNETV